MSPACFVRDAVEAVRREGVEVEVVSPASFRHFGIAYGHGIAGNLRRRPWLALLLPAFLLGYARAARRAARDADVVHAHWLPSGLAALATGKPYFVQLWGTDVEVARRAPWLFRPMLRRARLAIAAVRVPCRGRPRARRARGAHDPERRRDPGIRRPAGRPAARPLRRPPLARERHPRVPGGDGRDAACDRWCRTGESSRGGRLRPSFTSSARTTSVRASSACRRDARATASLPTRRWPTAARWLRRRSAGWRTRSRMASRVCSCPRGTSLRCGVR